MCIICPNQVVAPNPNRLRLSLPGTAAVALASLPLAASPANAAKVKRAIAATKRMRRWIFSEFASLQICTQRVAVDTQHWRRRDKLEARNGFTRNQYRNRHYLISGRKNNVLHLLSSKARMNRPSVSFIAFIKFLEKDEDLQSKIKVAENPQQIIDIAQSSGFTISSLELRSCSSDLSAHYFPWATKGNDFRRNFFKRKGQQQ